MYVSIHLIIFMDLDYGFAWSLLLQTVAEKPYIIYGLTTFLLLIPLALTSFDIWKKRLGKNWKRLHQLVYIIVPLAAYHYILSKKGDLFKLQGDLIRPLIYSLIIVILLSFRIPPVRRALASIRDRVLLLFRKRTLQPKPADPA